MKVTNQFNIPKSQVRRIKQSKESLRQLQHSKSFLGKKRKRDQEKNNVGGAFFIYTGNRENPDYREKKSSPQISSFIGSTCISCVSTLMIPFFKQFCIFLIHSFIYFTCTVKFYNRSLLILSNNLFPLLFC